MQILWAFRCNPGCMGEQRICVSKFATSPLRPTGFPGFGTGSLHTRESTVR
ncbi:MAG: hypothetical protein LBK44_01295 [Spirochaetales bacterium]|nr:hypothetical protein [Spirochaetales bacterium]